jgi:uncharacterized membrane protein (DUF485 family)
MECRGRFAYAVGLRAAGGRALSAPINPESLSLMVGHDHGPSTHVETEDEITSARNAKLGMKLFLLYLVFYAVYVGLAAFAQDKLRAAGFLGLNVAVLYGFGLIIAALLLALVYAWVCRLAAKR